MLRRGLLEDLGLQVPGSVQVPPAFPGDAAALLAATLDQGLEGIVLIFSCWAFLQVDGSDWSMAR